MTPADYPFVADSGEAYGLSLTEVAMEKFEFMTAESDLPARGSGPDPYTMSRSVGSKNLWAISKAA